MRAQATPEWREEGELGPALAQPRLTLATAPAGDDAGERRTVDFCGLPLTIGLDADTAVDLAFAADASRSAVMTTFINPHAYYVARRNPLYAANLAEFAYVLPDGIGVVWGVRLLRGVRTERISFDATSLALRVLARAAREGRSVMLIGGRPGVAERTRACLTGAVRRLEISGVVDGYRTHAEYERLVRAARPDIIVCGMGAPRQEALLVRLRAAGAWRGLGYTCGGFLDQAQERVRYYPPLVDRYNLRWLYRVAMEPRRLWRRYAIEYGDYGRALAREAWRRSVP